MGTKENMKQAVRELIGMAAAGEREKTEKTPQEDECARAVIRTVEEILGEGRAPAAEEETQKQAEEEKKEQPEEQEQEQERERKQEREAPVCPKRGGGPPEAAEKESTVIAGGITILGDIRSGGSIDFRGTLRGNLTAAGDIVLSGRVLGDVSGGNVTVRCGMVQGVITSVGAVEVGECAVILGDVAADTMDMNGRQKGDVRVEKMLILREKAVLVGSVTAQQISMAEGARVQLGVVVSRGDEEFPAFAELEI